MHVSRRYQSQKAEENNEQSSNTRAIGEVCRLIDGSGELHHGMAQWLFAPQQPWSASVGIGQPELERKASSD